MSQRGDSGSMLQTERHGSRRFLFWKNSNLQIVEKERNANYKCDVGQRAPIPDKIGYKDQNKLSNREKVLKYHSGQNAIF
jgi:hypothetical protein